MRSKKPQPQKALVHVYFEGQEIDICERVVHYTAYRSQTPLWIATYQKTWKIVKRIPGRYNHYRLDLHEKGQAE